MERTGVWRVCGGCVAGVWRVYGGVCGECVEVYGEGFRERECRESVKGGGVKG